MTTPKPCSPLSGSATTYRVAHSSCEIRRCGAVVQSRKFCVMILAHDPRESDHRPSRKCRDLCAQTTSFQSTTSWMRHRPLAVAGPSYPANGPSCRLEAEASRSDRTYLVGIREVVEKEMADMFMLGQTGATKMVQDDSFQPSARPTTFFLSFSSAMPRVGDAKHAVRLMRMTHIANEGRISRTSSSWLEPPKQGDKGQIFLRSSLVPAMRWVLLLLSDIRQP